MIGLGPYRLNAPSRPDWFFEREHYGGILFDIASHQVEQFLYFSGNNNATIVGSKVANYINKQYSKLKNFGDYNIVGENGATGYLCVDWLTPSGLSTWGDGRTLILGTKGYIELRKYVDISRKQEGDHVFLVNEKSEQYFYVKNQVGYPFFGQLILDCLNQTEYAMTQEHVFKTAELTLIAQRDALKVE